MTHLSWKQGVKSTPSQSSLHPAAEASVDITGQASTRVESDRGLPIDTLYESLWTAGFRYNCTAKVNVVQTLLVEIRYVYTYVPQLTMGGGGYRAHVGIDTLSNF